MPEWEHEHSRVEATNEPANPSALPGELAQFLAGREFVCLTNPSDKGTVLVVKIPGADIDSLRGPVPISFRHELYECPGAPVIRMVTIIYDEPERPLKLETFINVGDAQQRDEYENLCRQDRVMMLFYDEGLTHRLTKAVAGYEQETMDAVLRQADRMLAAIPRDELDFDRAKAAVMATIEL